MIDEKKLIELLEDEIKYQKENGFTKSEVKGLEYALKLVKMQPKVGEWIPFTLEDNFLNCPLPEEDQEILVTDGHSVWTDTFCRDGDDCYLDGGYEFVAEVTAWQPKPEPPKFIDTYKAKEGEKDNGQEVMTEECLKCKYCVIIESGAGGFIGETVLRCEVCEEGTEDKTLCWEADHTRAIP